jgi:hypothetical protein
MFIAKELGLTIAEALDKISDLELRLWISYYKVEAEEKNKRMKRRGR